MPVSLLSSSSSASLFVWVPVCSIFLAFVYRAVVVITSRKVKISVILFFRFDLGLLALVVLAFVDIVREIIVLRVLHC